MAAPFYYPWDPYGTNEKVSINILRAPIIFLILSQILYLQQNMLPKWHSLFDNIWRWPAYSLHLLCAQLYF